jgi:diguanylate cyclase (GGDEF)-like protein
MPSETQNSMGRAQKQGAGRWRSFSLLGAVKKSFRLKIILPPVIILVTLVPILVFSLTAMFFRYTSEIIDEKYDSNVHFLTHYVDEAIYHTKMAALAMAENPEAKMAIKERDADKIFRIFRPTHEKYGVNYYAICDSKGVAIKRTHAPDQFGDSIVYQQHVAEAMRGQISTYFDTGAIARVCVRTGAPVYDRDGRTLIGIISVGFRFDVDSTIQELQSLLHSEISVLLGDERINTTLKNSRGQSLIGTKIDSSVARTLYEDEKDYRGEVSIFGLKYMAYYMPLKNAKGKTYAAISLSNPLAYLYDAAHDAKTYGIIFTAAWLAISMAAMLVIVSKRLKPVVVLSNAMNDIAKGNLDVAIAADSQDEVGRLAASIKSVVAIIRQLLGNINAMIADRKKGKSDCTINTHHLSGEYKTLAANILELINVSSIDHLTGIANRRAMDQRLQLEWDRARRDRTSLAFLMVDLDRFKNYNDAFGHQQGDAALVAAAGVLAECVKRKVDLAARWGGEEFAILLPNADADKAMHVAEIIRQEIEKMQIPCTSPKASKITASVGAYALVPTKKDALGDLIANADKALYSAKNSGRNRTAFFEGPK